MFRRRALATYPIGGDDNVVEAYSNPDDWIDLPDLSSDTNRIVGLVAVHEHDSNFLVIRCQGAYTVDWGDGTTPENFASNVAAYHNYDFSNVSSSTLTSEGFRIAIVSITPQPSNNLTLFRINEKHTSDTNTGLASCYGWLDLKIKAPSLTQLNIGTATTSNTHIPRGLRQVVIESSNLSSYSSSFNNCSGLVRAVLYDSGNNITMSSTFNGCSSLRIVEGTETMTCTGNSSTFQNCVSLEIAPTITTTGTAASMFNGCVSLRNISGLDLSSATSLSGTFQTCRSLRVFTQSDFSSATTVASMFRDCQSLSTLGDFDFSSATSANSLFFGCSSLKSVGTLLTPLVQDFTSSFRTCVSLQSAPDIDTSAGTNFSNMFLGSVSMIHIKLYDMSSAVTVTSMFDTCQSLQELPALDLSSVTTATGLCAGCRSLSRSLVTGLAAGHSYLNCRLSSTELNAIYTRLVAASQTIIVTGNYGASGDTPSIATSKSWTVTG